jgi:hypothetical protein
VLTLGDLATNHPIGFAIGAGEVLVVPEFGFFLVSPRLLLDLPFKWRELVRRQQGEVQPGPGR